MTEFERFVDDVELTLNAVVDTGSDDELFISSYFHGHFSLAVSQVAPIEPAFDAHAQLQQLDHILTLSFVDAFEQHELSEPDQQHLWALWHSLKGSSPVLAS